MQSDKIGFKAPVHTAKSLRQEAAKASQAIHIQ